VMQRARHPAPACLQLHCHARTAAGARVCVPVYGTHRGRGRQAGNVSLCPVRAAAGSCELCVRAWCRWCGQVKWWPASRRRDPLVYIERARGQGNTAGR
jgi:hypothetical protein